MCESFRTLNNIHFDHTDTRKLHVNSRTVRIYSGQAWDIYSLNVLDDRLPNEVSSWSHEDSTLSLSWCLPSQICHNSQLDPESGLQLASWMLTQPRTGGFQRLCLEWFSFGVMTRQFDRFDKKSWFQRISPSHNNV